MIVRPEVGNCRTLQESQSQEYTHPDTEVLIAASALPGVAKLAIDAGINVYKRET